MTSQLRPTPLGQSINQSAQICHSVSSRQNGMKAKYDRRHKDPIPLRRSGWEKLIEKIPLFEPYSNFHQVWDNLIIVIVIFIMTSVPFSVAFRVDKHFVGVNYVIDIIFIVDIFVTFNTVAIDDATLAHIRDRRMIVIKYLSSWFILDVIAAMPLTILYHYVRGSSTINFIRCLKLLRLYNIYKLAKLKDKEEIKDIQEQGLHYFKLRIGFAILILLHFYACIWVFTAHTVKDRHSDTPSWIDGMEDHTIAYLYGTALYWVFVTVGSVGYGDIHAYNTTEMIVSIVIMLSGSLIMGIIVSQVSHFVSTLNPKANYMRNEINEVKGYLSHEKFPIVLRNNIYLAYKYYFQVKSGFEIDYNFKMIPREIYKKYLYSVYGDTIVILRKLFGEEMSIDMFDYTVPHHVSKDEVIYEIGDICHDITFVSNGEIRIKDQTGKIIGYIREGGYFGDLEFMRHSYCSYRYEAVYPCNLFTIPYSVMIAYLDHHTDDFLSMEDIMERRLRNMKQVVDYHRNPPKRKRPNQQFRQNSTNSTSRRTWGHIFTPTSIFGEKSSLFNFNRQERVAPTHEGGGGSEYLPLSTHASAAAAAIDIHPPLNKNKKQSSSSSFHQLGSYVNKLAATVTQTTATGIDLDNTVMWVDGHVENLSQENSTSGIAMEYSTGCKYRVIIPVNSFYQGNDGGSKVSGQQPLSLVKPGKINRNQSTTVAAAGSVSSTGVIKELTAHTMLEKFHVIHPLSRQKVGWDVMLVFLIMYTTIAVPIHIAFFRNYTSNYSFTSEMLIDAFFLLDIIVSLRTSHFCPESDAWIVDSRKLAFEYIFSWWFVIDIVSCIPWDLFVYLIAAQGDSSSLTVFRLLKLSRLLRLVKLVHIFQFDDVLDHLDQYLGIKPVFFHMLKLVVNVLFVAHLIACAWWGITAALPGEKWYESVFGVDITDRELFDRYVAALYWSVVTLTTTGYGDICPITLSERIVNIFVILFSATVFGYIVGQISNIMNDLMSNEKAEKLVYLKNYLYEQHCGGELIGLISTHYHELYEHDFDGNEVKILGRLSRKLRGQILLHKKQKIISTLPLFRYLPNQSAITSVIDSLSLVTVRKGDILGTSDDLLTKIYFILDGSLEVIPMDDDNTAVAENDPFNDNNRNSKHFFKSHEKDTPVLAAMDPSTIRSKFTLFSTASLHSNATASQFASAKSLTRFFSRKRMMDTDPVEIGGSGGGGNGSLPSLSSRGSEMKQGNGNMSKTAITFNLKKLNELYNNRFYYLPAGKNDSETRIKKKPAGRGSGGGKATMIQSVGSGDVVDFLSDLFVTPVITSIDESAETSLKSIAPIINDPDPLNNSQEEFSSHRVNALTMRVLGHYYSGDVIGLASVVKNKRSKIRICANELSHVYVLPVSTIDDIVHHMPALGYYLQTALGKIHRDQMRVRNIRFMRDYHIRVMEDYRYLCYVSHERTLLLDKLQIAPAEESSIESMIKATTESSVVTPVTNTIVSDQTSAVAIAAHRMSMVAKNLMIKTVMIQPQQTQPQIQEEKTADVIADAIKPSIAMVNNHFKKITATVIGTQKFLKPISVKKSRDEVRKRFDSIICSLRMMYDKLEAQYNSSCNAVDLRYLSQDDMDIISYHDKHGYIKLTLKQQRQHIPLHISNKPINITPPIQSTASTDCKMPRRHSFQSWNEIFSTQQSYAYI